MSLAAWAALGLVVTVLIAFDLVVFARGRTPSLKESGVWSVAWILVAVAFGLVFWSLAGGVSGGEYFAGYLLERSLSLDNVFVFAVLLGYFAIEPARQSKLLGWGIALAVVLRLIFILAGAALLDTFHATFYFFGLLLLYTAWRLARHSEAEVDPRRNPIVRAFGGKPTLAAFAAVATTDLIFAVDSIPAIFAVTKEPFIVFAANAFAMLGMRALYFLVVDLRERFVYLSQGLAIILAFVGVKMLIVDVWHMPVWVSLTAIALVLGTTIALSLRATAPPRLSPSPSD
jgi:tellurite resistance protein TerC